MDKLANRNTEHEYDTCECEMDYNCGCGRYGGYTYLETRYSEADLDPRERSDYVGLWR